MFAFFYRFAMCLYYLDAGTDCEDLFAQAYASLPKTYFKTLISLYFCVCPLVQLTFKLVFYISHDMCFSYELGHQNTLFNCFCVEPKFKF